jgi:hypothetical protein
VKPTVWILLAACGDKAAGTPDAPISIDSVAQCSAPDVLVVLDRTASMAERPDGTLPPNTAQGRAESKWTIALAAVEALSNQFQTSIEFGLALFPRAPTGTACITLAEKLSGATASNPQCQAGELLVAPATSTAGAIAAALDPETTRLCTSTPIGAGLATARTELAAIREPLREQYVLFVGDGADTCNDDLALANTDALARDGVKTFVVAFDANSPSGIDVGLLNDMACAGQTATGFPAGCVASAGGTYRAANRTGPRLFMSASDSAGLVTTFDSVAGAVCCGCIL